MKHHTVTAALDGIITDFARTLVASPLSLSSGDQENQLRSIVLRSVADNQEMFEDQKETLKWCAGVCTEILRLIEKAS